jgi:hypothetical protein
VTVSDPRLGIVAVGAGVGGALGAASRWSEADERSGPHRSGVRPLCCEELAMSTPTDPSPYADADPVGPRTNAYGSPPLRSATFAVPRHPPATPTTPTPLPDGNAVEPR